MKRLPNSMNGPLPFRVASFIVYNLIAVPVVGLIGLLAYGIRVKGRYHLRGVRGALVAANHCQYMEPGLAGVAVWPRKILFSAEQNNVTRKDVGWLTRLLRAFGIPDENPLSIGRFIQKALEKNWLVQFYPEGSISWRSQEPQSFLEGVFFFAWVNDAPVIPLAEVLHERPIRRLFPWWPPQTTFVFCEPVFPSDYRKAGLSRRDAIHSISEEVRNRILATLEAEGGCRNLPERRAPDPRAGGR